MAVGIADLNGFEVVPPEYKIVYYDGYTFYGTTFSGRKVQMEIHKRPSSRQSKTISDWGGYYSTMPWLMMPGLNYTPGFNVDWSESNMWDFPIYGGLGDYNSNELQLLNNTPRDLIEVRRNNLNSTVGDTCPSCKGSGKCHTCDGTKKASRFGYTYDCNTCNDRGECPTCNRSGKTSWNR